ncbi:MULTISPECIES: hypothetical protein [Acinetobacter]|uniref:Uncharacterized protein n=1 Tax=Acinetobacter piscicola TaxID=2006115 RepID=A0A7S7AI34_9GAMM|nr:MULTISPECIES: hypothetical protein [Acinetobacter]QOW46626.1 hypothetical protein G0028_12385 [Acinetobacter piscicola]
MKIELYPNFNDVFTDETLKGIFYPLCSVILDQYPNQIFHFISSNGLWMNENFETEHNTFQYTLFEIIDHKYKFHGDVKLYQGFEHAKNIFHDLQNDFTRNGQLYLKSKLKTEVYIDQQKRNLNLKKHDDFDLDYYLQTFYEFSINKLCFELNQEFGTFRAVIDDWSNGNKTSPIVYDETTNTLKGRLNHYEMPEINHADTFKVIGSIIGYEFFTDGNDTILHFDGSNQILCVNFYS